MAVDQQSLCVPQLICALQVPRADFQLSLMSLLPSPFLPPPPSRLPLRTCVHRRGFLPTRQ